MPPTLATMLRWHPKHLRLQRRTPSWPHRGLPGPITGDGLLMNFVHFRNPRLLVGRQSQTNTISEVSTAAFTMQPVNPGRVETGHKAGWDVLSWGIAGWPPPMRGV
jgi:hypothetical protein